MRLEKITGTIIGVAMLVTIFLLPFSSSISIISGSLDTLYGIFHFFASNLGAIPNVNNFSLELIAYFYLIGTALLLASGFTGSFPLVSGATGIVGIALLTVSGAFSRQYTPYALAYGIGFYLLWVLALAQLGTYLASRKAKVNLTVSPSVVSG